MTSSMRMATVFLLALSVSFSAQGCNLSSSDTAKASPSTSSSALPTTEGTGQQPAVPAPPPPPPAAAGWEVAGTSVQGRPLRLLTVGHGPRKVLFIGGIHGDEPEGVIAAAELPNAFESAGLAGEAALTILEDANPDGRAAGTRGNANGVDVNRNFPASNFDSTDPSNGGEALSEPEAHVVVQTIDRIAPNLVIIAHSWAGRQFINFDGPAREIAERFSAASGLPVEESSSFAPTPGSLGSYFGRDRKIPILTIEVLKGTDPTAVWEQLREALLQAIRG
jgi:murein peptide amidase A